MMRSTSGSGTVRWRNGAVKGQSKSQTPFSKQSNKQWVHPPDVLAKGAVVYVVKFLGFCKVDQPKGTEVVREAIRKIKFQQSLKKSEGQKPGKVELVVSIDALVILDIKSKIAYHQYPLHRISYCADDKGDKKIFTFIARDADADVHSCFVFSSDKCAEEITLTVGQAFDQAYRRFIDSSGQESDVKKSLVELQQKINDLEQENRDLKIRIKDLEKLKDRNDIETYLKQHQLSSITERVVNGSRAITVSASSSQANGEPVVGRRLENLVLDGFPTRGKSESFSGVLSPPPRNPRSGSMHVSPSNFPDAQKGQKLPPTEPNVDAFGCTPFTNPTVDAFGMSQFTTTRTISDQEFSDMRAGFSRGLSFGTEDFSLEMLDPLNQK